MKKTTHKKEARLQEKKHPAKKRPTKKRPTNPQEKSVKGKSASKGKRPAKKGNRKKTKKKSRRRKKITILLIEIGLTILLTMGIVYLLSLFTFSFARMDGYSMSDTLEDGDVVVVNKLAKLNRFDLVSIQVPNSKDKSIRRIIGRPGENVYYKNSRLYINQEEKEERFIADYKNQFEKDGMLFTEDFTLRTLIGSDTIPEDHYLVLGDNRPYATDSRYYKLIDEKEIIGTIEMRVLPLHKLRKF